jgi:Protein of unknown function (DUF3105)
VAKRKAEKEALRREREEREARARAEQQRKRMVGFGAAGALVLAAVVAVFLLVGGGGDGGGGSGGGSVFPEGGELSEQTIFEVEEAARAAGCELKDSRSRGQSDRLHTRTADVNVDYRDNPPTLGRHWPPGFEAQDGLYSESPADESLVHTLEHGRVIFWVKPSLPENARKTLRALFDQDSYQLVMTPRRNMPYAVAATAWNGEPQPGGTGRTLGCDRWTPEVVDALRAFRDEHRSNGPEPVP